MKGVKHTLHIEEVFLSLLQESEVHTASVSPPSLFLSHLLHLYHPEGNLDLLLDSLHFLVKSLPD